MKTFALIIAAAMPWLGFVAAAKSCLNGVHVQGANQPGCSCSGGTVTCNSFQLCGVGNVDGTATLDGSVSGLVTCTNNGGKTVDVKTQPVSAHDSEPATRGDNGCLTFPEVQISRPSDDQLKAMASCPNDNWTKALKGLSGAFTYSVTFGT